MQKLCPKSWWDEESTVPGMSRNDLSLILVGLVLVALSFKFPINWDFVFGLR